MLASTGDAPLHDQRFAYEPKYDGIRAIVSIEPPARKGASGRVAFWSRLGNDKTGQFPDIAAALEQFARTIDGPLIVDGEIVALDERGGPIGFQNLQRIHMKAADETARVALYVFDLIRDGGQDLRPLPLRDRRARLEALLRGVKDPRLRISEQEAGDGRPLHARAQAGGWEGLIAKRLDAPYKSGRRSPEWRKLKLERRQACVVAGWTEPRGSRPFFGALLLGVYDDAGRLKYIGHTGAGFADAELGRVWKKLHALRSKTSPFPVVPRTNETPHWVVPKLVAEVKFTEWTADQKLRHPTYLGLRDDIKPETVKKEPDTLARGPATGGPEGPPLRMKGPHKAAGGHSPARGRPRGGHPAADVEADLQVRLVAADRAPRPATKAALTKVLDQLEAIEYGGGGSGVLQLPGGDRLEVSNLGKVFWPKLGLTKGDLLRHYTRVSPFILPVLADRPLVMKRYPNGVAGKPFYQHRAPDKIPAGVRVERVGGGSETRPHLIGGSLVTLLYTAQLASISQDPWFSRAGSEDIVDHVAIDLDPPDGLPFAKVLDVARWVRDELALLKAPAFPKTSGAGGLHIYVPMAAGTPHEAGLLFCQIVATMVAKKHPKAATVERAIAARGQRIYVDYLQNIRGKTLASAYSARANDFAGVSAPLTWDEIDEGVAPKDFTVKNFAARVEAVGDLWAGLRKSKGADLRGVENRTKAKGKGP